jgi:hypothetical protein
MPALENVLISYVSTAPSILSSGKRMRSASWPGKLVYSSRMHELPPSKASISRVKYEFLSHSTTNHSITLTQHHGHHCGITLILSVGPKPGEGLGTVGAPSEHQR